MGSYTVREVPLLWPITNTDGNIVFDTICVSDDVSIFVRHIDNYQWYKDFYTTMRVATTVKGRHLIVLTLMILICIDDNKRRHVRALS